MRPLLYDNPIRQWLIKEIYVSHWIFIDRWSLVHFASGIMIGLILRRYTKGIKFFLSAFLILFLWEIWENFSGQMIFGTESMIDLIWDMIIGMLGAIIAAKLSPFARK